MKETSFPRSLVKYLAGLSPTLQEKLTPLLMQVQQALAQADASVDTVVQVLAANPLATPEEDLILIEALARLPHPVMPAVLQTYFGSDRKDRRKVLKKAWHQLKAQGIAVPEEYFREHGPGILTSAAESAAITAYVSRIENNGSRMVILYLPGQGQLFNLMAVLANDEEGLLDGYAMAMGRNEVKRYLEQVRAELPGTLAPVDPGYAFGVLEACWQRHPEADNEVAKTYQAVRPLLQQRLGDLLIEDVTTLLPQPSEVADYVQDTANLLLMEDFFQWTLSPEEISPWLEKIQAVNNSPLHLSDEQIKARYEDIMRQALQELFPPSRRQLLAQRLLHMAYYLECSDRPYHARLAQAAALDVARERSLLEEESFFLTALFMLPLEISLKMDSKEQEAAAEPGRIITV